MGYGYFNILYVAMGPPNIPVVTDVTTTPMSAIVTWRVPIITFDHENYLVDYGIDMTIPLSTGEVTGNADLNTVNDTFSVTITGLTPFTTYYYVVTATNSNGSTSTGPMTFTTDEAGMLF